MQIIGVAHLVEKRRLTGVWIRFAYALSDPNPIFVDLLRSPGIDSQPDGPVRQLGKSSRPARLLGWRNRFLGFDSGAP
jgi:hypothetical protein